MTEMQAARALLDSRWETSISGRSTDVPEPEIVLEKNVSQSDLKTGPIARIVDGGGKTFEPRGFGWTHQRVEADVTVELRTATRRVRGGLEQDGHAEMFGNRPSPTSVDSATVGDDGVSGIDTEPDRYVGLTGEVRRILEAHRKGFAEFCNVYSSEIRNESSAEGTNYYRADVDIRFVQEADKIDPSP